MLFALRSGNCTYSGVEVSAQGNGCNFAINYRIKLKFGMNVLIDVQINIMIVRMF